MARFMRRARKMAERLKIVKDDPWLEPVEGELEYRRKLYLDALKEIEEASESIADYADGYLYFGGHGLRGGRSLLR